MKRGAIRFGAGVAIGYCLVQGLAYLNQHYFWALFYR